MELPDHYGIVLLMELLISLQIFLLGFIVTITARKNAFNKEYMQEHFGDFYANELGRPIDDEGYPDSGSGKFSKPL